MTNYTMKAYKHDNKLHYEQPLSFYKREDNYIALKGKAGRTLTHYTRNTTFLFDKNTIEYFFTDRWYTSAFVFNKQGICDYIYCNICFPSKIDNNVVSFIDLDIDVIYDKGQIIVVDQDEFEAHQIKYHYSKETIKKVIKTTKEVQQAIENKSFPFNLYI